jgi:hypothetical protein
MNHPSPSFVKLLKEILIAAVIVALICIAPSIVSIIFPTISDVCRIASRLMYEFFPIILLILLMVIHLYSWPWKRRLALLLTMVLLSPVLFIIFAFYRFTLGGLFDHFFQSIYYFAFGWMYAVPLLLMAIMRHPLAWGLGLLGLIALPFALHQLAIRVFVKQSNTWHFRQSVAVAGIVCSCVLMSVSMIALTQECFHFVRPQDNLTERWSMGERIDAHGRPIENKPLSESAQEASP